MLLRLESVFYFVSNLLGSKTLGWILATLFQLRQAIKAGKLEPSLTPEEREHVARDVIHEDDPDFIERVGERKFASKLPALISLLLD